MHRIILYVFCISLIGCTPPEVQEYDRFVAQEGTEVDLWIKNGQIIDGTGTPAFQADILIRGEEIRYIGWVNPDQIKAQKTIDASNKILSPGFIDAHAHGNPIRTPGFENFLAMGVTTISLGQDGSSTDPRKMEQWIQQVDSIKSGVNIALFVGHGTLRRQSGIAYDPNPSPAAMDSMLSLLQKAFDLGCFGMSTGLEYTPGVYAQDPEMLALAKVVGTNDGLIMSHVRNEDNDAIQASLEELLRQGAYCRVHAAHLKVVYGQGGKRAEEVLDLLFGATAPPNVSADVYPYTASYTGIGIVFPAWAKPPNDYESIKTNRRAELLEFLRNKIEQRNGPEATLFGTTRYAGLTLADLAKAQGRPYEEILLDIGPGGASGAYFIMNEDLQERLVQHPKVMISSDGSPTMRHPRGYGSFAKVIEEYVLQDSLFDLANAVHKMSGLTAKTIGLTDRGILSPGQKADLLIFDPSAIKAKATYAEPHQLATGMDYVFVNGKLAYPQTAASKNRWGKVLRKK